MGIPDHLTSLMKNLCAGHEARVRTEHGTMDCFQIGKGVCQGCILSPCLFNLYAEYIMRNSRLGDSQTGTNMPGKSYQQPQIHRWYHSSGRKWRGTKEPLDEGEEEGVKAGLKTQHSTNKDHGIWSHHFMPNRWGKSGNSDRFYFLRLQNHCEWWPQTWN